MIFTFGLDLTSDLNPSLGVTHPSVALDPLEILTMNNPRLAADVWTRNGPPTIPNRAMVNCFLPRDFKMKILVWNCREAADQNFQTNVRDLISQYSPNLLILIETRLSSDRAHAMVITCLLITM